MIENIGEGKAVGDGMAMAVPVSGVCIAHAHNYCCPADAKGN